MKTVNTINILKMLPLCHLSEAGTYRRILLHWVVALLACATAVTPLRAKPVVSNNDGYFFDDYVDSLGIFTASQVRVTGGTVSLITPNLQGNYRTVEIVPTSFDQWNQLTLVGTYGALSDLQVEVRSQDGLTVLIARQPVNGPINLSSLNSPLVPGIRVQVYFDNSGVAPTVDSLEVTWQSVAQVLLNEQAPAQVQAGESIAYSLSYSV